jgi:hypothetical protein
VSDTPPQYTLSNFRQVKCPDSAIRSGSIAITICAVCMVSLNTRLIKKSKKKSKRKFSTRKKKKKKSKNLKEI